MHSESRTRDHRRTRSDGGLSEAGEPSNSRTLSLESPHEAPSSVHTPRDAFVLPSPPPDVFISPHRTTRSGASRHSSSTPAETPEHNAIRSPTRSPTLRGADWEVMVFLGYAGPDREQRRALVSLICSLLWWAAQFITVIALLAYSAVHESPTKPGVTEWRACNKPLGAWNAVWLVKVVLSAWLTLWGWQRQRRNNGASTDPSGSPRTDTNDPESRLGGDEPTNRESTSNSHHRRTYEAAGGRITVESTPNAIQSKLFARVSLFASFFAVAWFVTAHVLEYTSIDTCRLNAPHLWWLTFGILATLYLMILEIFLLGLLVFILGPVLFLVYNILLLCLGRHPLQNPNAIRPDVDKLSKAVVERIPLVLYIPPPPGGETNTNIPITVPAAAHSYPPKGSGSSPDAPPKRRFAFFRKKKAGKGAIPGASSASTFEKGSTKDGNGGADAADEDEDEDVPWDEMWERSEYPFVRLEDHRAACAICLLDYAEPKRVRGVKPPPVPASDAGGREGEDAIEETALTVHGPSTSSMGVTEIRVEAVSEEEHDALTLMDAGEGPQPLRLLSCGHVFHKTCVDPWLTDVSGRCPICQRQVVVPKPSKKERRRRRRNRT
ncbi:uncharacterized protein BXZ73DRAFT_90202 [Epithele typhae]|uniref:uncharacterized protein n=1 Tax=Epithele typhae TaxID=378194 RepID=UPI002007A3B5|nr:uncharacterized protein BXZ73DRAFT_90202 [Epithele typhae]KAH9931124.1 hypothetical protein BXZ73DRAFT_90202 [Epithele typhae]